MKASYGILQQANQEHKDRREAKGIAACKHCVPGGPRVISPDRKEEEGTVTVG